MSKTTKLAVGVLAIILVAGGVYAFNQDDPYEGWEMYRDEKYKFEMRYPPNWTPQFLRGEFAGFYDAGYENWLENFDEAVRVGPEVIDFYSVRNEFIKRGEKEPTLKEYVFWFNENTKLDSDAESTITEVNTADGTIVIKDEGFSSVATPPGVYAELYIPVPDGRVYTLTTRAQYVPILDQMISTLKITE